MKAKALVAWFLIIFSSTGLSAKAGEVSDRVELAQTGESARVHNPECKSGNLPTAADVLLKLGTGLVDKYIGYPVTTTIYENTSPGNRDWIKARLGIHNGKSSCQTLCVVYPKSAQNVKVSTCLSETGGDGLGCRHGDNGDVDPPAYAGVDGVSKAETSQGIMFCATGKNWSHNKDRWYTVKATWQ